jgi:hypothetical protein
MFFFEVLEDVSLSAATRGSELKRKSRPLQNSGARRGAEMIDACSVLRAVE